MSARYDNFYDIAVLGRSAMKATMISTDVVTTVDGVPARVWKATTDSGIEFVAFIARVAVPETSDRTQFEAELRTVAPPRELSTPRVLEAFSTRML